METGTADGATIGPWAGSVNEGGAITGGWRPAGSGEGDAAGGDDDTGAGAADVLGGVSRTVVTPRERPGAGAAAGAGCGATATDRDMYGVHRATASYLAWSHQAGSGRAPSGSQSRAPRLATVRGRCASRWCGPWHRPAAMAVAPPAIRMQTSDTPASSIASGRPTPMLRRRLRSRAYGTGQALICKSPP